ncbi:MAG: hypothetical protein K2Y56_21230 [Methylobacterium sp.]|uniref:hypothetical protein n=1 Tax=Methylobacterium sp. TaxID=409 RepID=UPI0025F500CC|nr:hypothetical protein [Methylobacterium sp.]MBX9934009.1 hypothetical protein [Methylobacterium sp.]
MTPTDLLHRCGFLRAENHGLSTAGSKSIDPVEIMTFRPSWGHETATVELAIAPRLGRAFYEATIDGVDGGPFVLGTEDPRDLAVLALALRDSGGPDMPSDPALRMVGPTGPVANPFAFEDGSWSFATRADGRRHLDDPASRWGDAYTDHKRTVAARFEDRPLEAAPAEYLAAAGFSESGGALRLVLHPMAEFEAETEETRRTPLSITVVDGDRGGVPDQTTSSFEVRATDSDGDILDVVYRAGDVRDVLAFVDAAGNAVVTGHGYFAPEGRTFGHVWSGMAIHNPFAEGSYGDWNVVEKTAGQIVVADPWTVWGHEYFAWRDERSAAVLSRASPGAPGPGARA